MNRRLAALRKQVQRELYSDGLDDISSGVFFIIILAISLIKLPNVISNAIVLAGVVLSEVLQKRIRRDWIFPRSGVHEGYKKRDSALLIVVFGCMAGYLLLGLALGFDQARLEFSYYLPFIFGSMIAALCLNAWFVTGFLRYLLYDVFLVVPLMVALFGFVSPKVGFQLVCVSGLPMIFCGIRVLKRYICTHEVVENDTEEQHD